MKINLKKLSELIPQKFILKYTDKVYLLLLKENDLYDKVRYIDILAYLLGGLGVASVECDYLIQSIDYKSYVETSIELQAEPKYAMSDISFKLSDNLTVEIHGYDYTIENVLLAHKLLKQFDLYE